MEDTLPKGNQASAEPQRAGSSLAINLVRTWSKVPAFRLVCGLVIVISLVALAMYALLWVEPKIIPSIESLPSGWKGTALDQTGAIFRFARATNITGGLSLLIPLFCIGMGFYVWSVHHLKRLSLNHRFEITAEIMVFGRLTPGAAAALRSIQSNLTRCGLRSLPGGPLIGFLTATWLLPCYFLLKRSLPTLEGWASDGLIEVSAALLYLFVLLGLFKFAAHWRGLRSTLVELAAHPVGAALDRIPKDLSTSLGDLLSGREMSKKEQNAAAQVDRELEHALRAAHAGVRTELEMTQPTFDRLASLLQTPPRKDNSRAPTRDASEILIQVLEPVWTNERSLAPSTDAFKQAAENFLAVQAVVLVREVFAHLRNHLFIVLSGFLLLVAAISTYPFQPRRLLMLAAFTLTLPAIALLFNAFVQMDRDEVVSKIGRTTPGHITWDQAFFGRVLTYGIVPLAGLFAGQFPDSGRLVTVLTEIIRKALP
jgi:hypothetical protein